VEFYIVELVLIPVREVHDTGVYYGEVIPRSPYVSCKPFVSVEWNGIRAYIEYILKGLF